MLGVLELKKNLISLSTLDAIGYSVKIDNGVMKVMMDPWLHLGLSGIMVCVCCKAFELSGKATITHSLYSTMLWHSRLGHVSEKSLSEFSKHGVLGSEPLGY